MVGLPLVPSVEVDVKSKVGGSVIEILPSAEVTVWAAPRVLPLAGAVIVAVVVAPAPVRAAPVASTYVNEMLPLVAGVAFWPVVAAVPAV